MKNVTLFMILPARYSRSYPPSVEKLHWVSFLGKKTGISNDRRLQYFMGVRIFFFFHVKGSRSRLVDKDEKHCRELHSSWKWSMSKVMSHNVEDLFMRILSIFQHYTIMPFRLKILKQSYHNHFATWIYLSYKVATLILLSSM